MQSAVASNPAENRLVLAHVYTATIAVCLGAVFGVLQAFSRADALQAPQWFDYYRMLTAHGVLMALVFTTFFITGLAEFVLYRNIARPDRKLTVGWIGWWLMFIGTAVAAAMILAGNATVLYTFYAPLKASPFFYLGATVLVLGTWVVAYEVFENVLYFRRNHPGAPIPLPVFMMATTFLMWIIATLGVVAEMYLLIPWAFGWTPGINVLLTRMFFWYFGHPLVYFWIMGAYVIWYTIIPTRYNGTVFSDGLARLTFLMLLILSTPVGIHHEFMEPIASKWKLLHMVMTYGVVIPSFLTAFAIFASFELAAIKNGQRGFIRTVTSLPWNDPFFAAAGYGMLLFILGGFGGMVNASYSMDTLVHNTIWIVGHFHATVGGPVALTFIGATYWLIPRLTGRELWGRSIALWQARLWFIGMLIMSLSMHYAGLLGAPRRTASVDYAGAAAAAPWEPAMLLAAAGGGILFISICFFATVAIGTLFKNEKTHDTLADFAPAEAGAPTPAILQHLFRWSAVALVLAVLAYTGPFIELFHSHVPLAPGLRTW
ncbi:MAG TPA: cbb3-type cytochrome c oxidase subunit I [Candidatus Baltobacteraceae bacterium]|nr:cbb3-type cytochrome c oxidase subunit I [Candidatus Baltobacteraceae bacterium]